MRRPEVTSFSIDDLLGLTQQGRLRVPPLQRGFRWTEQDRVDLFDSIHRGFPVGALLLWRRDAEEGPVSFGRWKIDAPARSGALWLLDGQQRVTTLVEALLCEVEPHERSVHLDLGSGVFTSRAGAEEPAQAELPGITPVTSMPLCEAHDVARLTRWLLRRPLDDGKLSAAVEAGKRLREYRIPAYIVETDDPEELRQVFDRINRAGARLADVEVFGALFGSLREQGPSDLERVARSLDGLGFGALDADLVLRALRAIAGLPVGDFSHSLRRDATPALLRQTEAALRRAVVFLQINGEILHLSLLPYTLPLVALARFFHEHPAPQPRTRSLLRCWLWRGSLGLALGGTTAQLRQHLDCIDKDEEPSAQRLLDLAGRQIAPDVLRIDRFNFHHARGKLQACALGSLHPRELGSGKLLDLAALFADSPALPSLAEPHRSEHAGGLAGRMLHPRLPAAALARAICAEEDEPTLASHAITREAQSALRDGDLDRFLAERSAALAPRVERYFVRQADWKLDE